MSCFFAEHPSSKYAWGRNSYEAQDSHNIGKLAARISRICDKTKFNVASAMKYMIPNTKLPRHRDTERNDAHRDRRPFIASVSIGPNADFALFPKNKPPAKFTINSGDLVLFYGSDEHSASTGEMYGKVRYNLTCRTFITPEDEKRTQRSWSYKCVCRNMTTEQKVREAQRPARMRLTCSIHNSQNIYNEPKHES